MRKSDKDCTKLIGTKIGLEMPVRFPYLKNLAKRNLVIV